MFEFGPGSNKPAPRSGSRSNPPDQRTGKKNISDYLLAESIITPWDYEIVNMIRVETGASIVAALISQEAIKADVLYSFICHECKIPHLSLLDYEISREVLGIIPRGLCEEHFLLPIDKLGRILTVAMLDPTDEEAIEAIRHHVPDLRIKAILCNPSHLKTVFSRLGYCYADPPPKILQETPKPVKKDFIQPAAKKDPTEAAKPAADDLHQSNVLDPLTNDLFEAAIYRVKDPAVMSALSVKLFDFLSRLDHLEEQIAWLEKNELHLHLFEADMKLINALESSGPEQALALANNNFAEADSELKAWVLSLDSGNYDVYYIASLMFMIGRLGNSKYQVEGFIRTLLSDKIKPDPKLGD